ncbi:MULTISPECIES: hypothetical protein [Clostridium]|uniref:hypothetical protein n=1 Tax=Clostridium TaxID=1485 RepID=UPI0012FE045E|nr:MULTISPECIES: hypothetical protein [Clostridium]
MKTKKVIINGKRRIVIVNDVSGVDKTLEAVLRVMGSNWEYDSNGDVKSKGKN